MFFVVLFDDLMTFRHQYKIQNNLKTHLVFKLLIEENRFQRDKKRFKDCVKNMFDINRTKLSWTKF